MECRPRQTAPEQALGKMPTKHFCVRGRVQGVGFRAWLAAEATALGLKGWVRNISSGDVEALLAGDIEHLKKIEVLLHEGPPLANVASVQAAESSAQLEHSDHSVGVEVRKTADEIFQASALSRR